MAVVQGRVTPERLALLKNGVQLEDGKTAPAQVKILRQENHKTVVEISIHEGRNRQVRRMFKAIKNPVLELKRISVGSVNLKGVNTGEYRYLTDAELKKVGQRLGLHLSGGQA